MDNKVINTLQEIPNRFNVECYLVGGAIRDAIVKGKMETGDYDFVVSDKLIEILEFVGTELGVKYHYEPKYQTGKIKFADLNFEIDFVQTRKEIYEKPGALPKVLAGSAEEDLLRRDFTINTLRIRVADLKNVTSFDNDYSLHFVIDSLGGLADLKNGKIRVLHSKSFIDDPTRLYRALRYAAKINGKLEDDTEALFKDALRLGALKTISYARRLNEIKRCLEDVESTSIVNLIINYSLFRESFPLDQKFIDNFYVALRYLLTTQSNLLEKFKLMTAFFLIDENEKVFSAFTWSKKKINAVHGLIDQVKGNQYSLEAIKSAIERF